MGLFAVLFNILAQHTFLFLFVSGFFFQFCILIYFHFVILLLCKWTLHMENMGLI